MSISPERLERKVESANGSVSTLASANECGGAVAGIAAESESQLGAAIAA